MKYAMYIYSKFQSGYEPDGRVERWQHTVVGREGELGAIQGESLSLKHDLLLIRDPEDKATPIL